MTPADVKHVIDGRFNRLRVLDIVAVEEKREPAMLFQEKVGGMRRQAVLSGEIADTRHEIFNLIVQFASTHCLKSFLRTMPMQRIIAISARTRQSATTVWTRRCLHRLGELRLWRDVRRLTCPCAPSAPAAKPRLVARERSGGANEGGLGATSVGFVFQVLAAGRAQGGRRDVFGFMSTGKARGQGRSTATFRIMTISARTRQSAATVWTRPKRGVSMRMDEPPPCGWMSHPHAGGTAPGVLGHWAAFAVYYPP